MRYTIYSSLLLLTLTGCTIGGARHPTESTNSLAQVTASPLTTQTPYVRRELSRKESRDLNSSVPKSARRILEQSAELELSWFPSRDGEKIEKKTVVLMEAGAKAELLDALYAGLVESVKPSMCFYPRHSIKATFEGKSAEIKVCFECGNFRGFISDGESFGGTMGNTPLTVFTNFLEPGNVKP